LAALRGLTWRHTREYAPLVAAARAFERLQPDVAVEWEQLPWAEFRDTSHAEMARRSGRYDLYMFDHPWVGTYAANGWLVRLDGLLTPEQRSDLAADADPASYRSYWYGGGLYGLPVDASCHVLHYRPDLIEAARLPGDWDGLLDLAGRVHRPPGRHAFAHPWTADGGNATLAFIALLRAAGERPFEDRARLSIDPRTAGRCLEIMRRIAELSIPPERLRGSDVRRHLIDHDDVAMTVSYFAYINYAGDVGRRRQAVCDVPVLAESGVRSSMLGGMGLGISADSPQRDAAWEYAWFVMSRDVQEGIYLESGGQPGRLSALGNPVVDARREGFCTVLRRALADCYVRPTYPGWLLIENGANHAVHRYLVGDYTVDDVCAAFSRQAGRVWRATRR
jgi:multiple sugar transport system substrate-binding protein